ncbi:MAG: SUMF1/EgtB/PvdO family nonheme iron enzyme, partial [Lysobacterales bacterium]
EEYPPEQERWRVDDLYEKPQSQWHRKPAVWAGVAALIAATFLAVFLSGRGEQEASPLDLVTGEGQGAGIGLGNQARKRKPEVEQEPEPAVTEQAAETNESAAQATLKGEEDLDALLAEMLVEDSETEAPATQPDTPSTQADLQKTEQSPGIQPAGTPTQEPSALTPSADPPARTAQPDNIAQRTQPTPTSRPDSAPANPKTAQLLLDAELLLAADQLTLPAGENAWEAYQQVLDLDASNREALRGLARIQRTYVNRINGALDNGDLSGARRLTERLKFIDPLHPDLDTFEQALGTPDAAATPFQDPLSSGGLGPLMVRMDSAQVTIGNPDRASEGLVTDATVPAFALGAFEVTVGEYRQFAQATGLKPPASAAEGCNYWLFNWRQRQDKTWESPGFNQSESHPVVCISYEDAIAYTRWLSEQTNQRYGLPSEFQWESAAAQDARGGVYWTNARSACDYANVSDIDRAERHNLEVDAENLFGCRDRRVNSGPVGSHNATSAGLFDLLGNAGEWTADCWRRNFTGPLRTDACEAGVVRGGSWFERPREVSVHHRLRLERTARFSHIGFRVARELAPD